MKNLIVYFGPSIGVSKYEVDKELAEKFDEAGFYDCISYPSGEEGKPHINLERVNEYQLLRRGVVPGHIKCSDFCTYSSSDNEGKFLFPSYRRDKTSERLYTCIRLTH